MAAAGTCGAILGAAVSLTVCTAAGGSRVSTDEVLGGGVSGWTASAAGGGAAAAAPEEGWSDMSAGLPSLG